MSPKTFLLAMLALMPASAAQVLAAIPEECASSEQAAAIVALPHVAAALKPGATLNVLAVGSASLFGPEANLKPVSVAGSGGGVVPDPPSVPEEIKRAPSAAAFPLRMAQALESAIPGAHVTVSVRGGRGLTTDAQAELLGKALKDGSYQLVLWQTGTVEAVRSLSPADFATTLAQGAETVEQSGADLVLIDPQFSRFLEMNSNIEAYELAFQQVTSASNVMLFHRFALMRSWVNSGRFDLERIAKSERRHAVEQLHACLGQTLADVVVQGAQQPP